MNPLIVSHVSKTFNTKAGKIAALCDVSLEVKPGEMFGLLGPNGAGKSTLINVMLGLLTPDAGEVRILDQKITPDILRQINIIAGGSYFNGELTPNDILKFYAKVYRIPNPAKRINDLAHTLKLDHLMNRKFNWFSTGERLRVAFAKALLNNPKVLLMDEPTLGLDPDVARTVRKEVQELNKTGTTILLTSHYMHEVEQLCKRIAFIYQGKIVDIGDVKKIKLKRFATYDVILTLNKKPSLAFVKEHELATKGTKVKATLSDEEALSNFLAGVHEAGYRVQDIAIKKPTLEDYFIKVLGEQQ